MIEFYQLEQLLTIAKVGTISKAAEVLLISQPALTRSIQRLEDELGIQLFDRKKNKVELNANGKLAVELFEKLLNDKEKIVNTLQAYNRSQYEVKIGSCAPAPIWGLRHVFKKLYPEMQIHDVLDSREDILLQGLKNYEFSIIVFHHSIDDPDYECVPLFEENLFLSVPPAHPLALFPEISFDDLNGESVLLLSKIGFWNEICQKVIPQSHLLFQEDGQVFNELIKASALPHFRSDITMKQEGKSENRKAIPISDPQAHVMYYGIYRKTDRKIFSSLLTEVQNLHWEDVSQVTESVDNNK